MKNRLLNSFFKVFLAVLLCSFISLVLRVYEANYLESNLFLQFEAFKNLGSNFFRDLKGLVLISLLIIPFIFLKRITLFILVYFNLIIVVNTSLTQYFLTNFDLLGSELYTFSLEEIIFILKTEMPNVDYKAIFILIISPLFFTLFFKYLVKKLETILKLKSSLALIYLVFLTIIFFDIKYYMPKLSKFKNHHQYILANNKLSYFIYDSFSKSSNVDITSDKVDLISAINNYNKARGIESLIDKRYPFLRNEKFENVLGPYFKESTEKPNVVFLLVESLSRSFSGPNAHLGSFTPFLDSISEKSLYWENFLSNAERTYGVLPNVLSSVASFGGFTQKTPYLKHNSIIKELAQNKYSTSFHYGGWANFTGMETYLKYHNIDSIYADKSFDSTLFKKHESKENDFHWGYDDKALFEQYFLHLNEIEAPYLSILLTISMHSPFDVDEKYTLDSALNYLEDITEEQSKLAEAHPEKITAIAFDDQMLKEFFNEYKQRKDYENTIFIITGDHNIHALPKKNSLDVFHVPLMIYSPLLTKTAKFKGVSTHRDIAPSLLSLLENNFDVEISETNHWLGNGLSVSENFENKVITPMVTHMDSNIDFIADNRVVFQNEVYIVTENFDLELEKNQQKKEGILKLYDDYRVVEQFVYNSKTLFKYEN